MALTFNGQPLQVSSGAPDQDKVGGGFEPSAFISEGSGIGGAGLGALIGSLGGPIGSVIGAGIGGFLGGTGGSAVEQQVRDGEIDLGKALKEGTIEGIFSAGPLRLIRGAGKGFKLVRAGGNLADEAGKLAGGADDLGGLLSQMGNAGQVDNVLSSTGKSLRGTGRGIRSGLKANGEQLMPSGADELNEWLTRYAKTGGGSADKQLRKLEPVNEKLNKELVDAVKDQKVTLTTDEQTKLANNIFERVQDEVGLGTLQTAAGRDSKLGFQFLEELDNIKGIRKAEDLNNMLKRTRNKKNFGRSPGSKTPESEAVFDIFQQELKKTFAEKLPQGQAIKDNLRMSIRAQNFLLNRSGLSGSTQSLGGATLPSSAAQTMQGRSGQMLETLGRGLGATGPVAAGTRAGVAGALGAEGPAPAELNTQGSEDMVNQLASGLGGGATGMQIPGVGAPQEPTSGLTFEDVREAMIQDIAETGGENIDQINLIAQLYGIDMESGGAPETNEKIASAKKIVDELVSDYSQKAGGAQGVYGGTASNVAGFLNIGEGNQQARAFEETRMSYLTPIIKAFGEVGVLTDKDREVIADAIPSITDTPVQAEQKLSLLYRILATLANTGDTGSGTSNDATAGGVGE